MFREYLVYKKAKNLMKAINKVEGWEAEIKEDKYNKKLEIKHKWSNPDIEDITKIMQKLMDLCIKFNVSFYGGREEDKFEFSIYVR